MYYADMMVVVIVFGEMGAGKNHHGERIAHRRRLGFFDGDTVIPPEMTDRVRKFKPLSQEMLNKYINGTLYAEIVRRVVTHPRGVVVAQALYRDKNRLELKRQLESGGISVEFVWVRASFWQNLWQIASRPRAAKWVAYWLASKAFFEKPTHSFTDP